MKERDEERITKLLQSALPPVSADAEPGRDLWPAVLMRLDAKTAAVPWFDWALAGALAVFLALTPSTIPLLLYYL